MMLCPKDDRDLLAKKKPFETNSLNFFLEMASVSNFMALQIKIIQDSPGKLFSLAPPSPPPRNSIDHPWGEGGYGYFLEPHIENVRQVLPISIISRFPESRNLKIG